MGVPGFFAQEVLLPHIQCPTLGAGLPSPIQRFTVSAWCCNATSLGFTIEGALQGDFTRSVMQFLFSTSGASTTTKQLALLDFFAVNHGGVKIVDGGPGAMYEFRQEIDYYDQITSDGVTEWYGLFLTHFIATVDFIAQTVVVYANDQPLTNVTTGSVWHTATAPNATVEAPWQLYGSGPGGAVADVWMTPTVLDISNVAVRRQFINADLSAVALPSDGHITVSGSTITPVVFLHALSSGSPSDFVANNGTGPDWSVTSGTLSFVPEPGNCVQSRASTGGGTPPPAPKLAMDNLTVTATTALLSENLVSLRWSDDRGHSWGSPVTQDIGEAGEYRTSLQWQRLAYARDRVFEISWSVPMRTALQGCWVDVTPAQS